ncbi:hypothetical protein [Streptomyces sp. NBC_01451]|uniref:hypothetical protein n=1 Tax=Streptomyces sp. NBC_01451 TaxID=2903872 RepID=UPI002E2F803E|nr:hypothetical protein [Streptomyces sp. NBC_01451]
MPGFALTTAAALTCAHQGQVTLTPGQQQVLAGGAPVVTTADVNVVAPSCVLSSAQPPSPCVKVDFGPAASTHVLVRGRPLVVQPAGPGTGLGQSAAQAPQGPPVVSTVQQRVVAT